MMMNTINHNHHHHHHHHSSHNGSSSNFPDKMQRTQDYVEALEEERKKILVFQRELPLCLELVTQAIETCKHQLCGTISECNFHGGQSECSEQTSTEGPVLEEFIPLKRTSFSDDEDEQEHSRKSKRSNSNVSKKSDWLRSVQLWNQTPDPPKTSEISPKRVAVTEVKRNSGGGGAFHPFMREKSVAVEDKTAAAKPETPPKNNCGGDRTTLGQVAEASSTADTGGSTGGGNGNGKKEEKDGQSSSSQRKSRRCWSPELHKRFLSSLHQLGGAHVATPKQIRELMKVDGLTNDEVKSHLQKYRLHTRRPSPTIHNNMSNPQAPQFVVVGGIWVPPPPEYAAMAAATGSGEACGGGGSSNGIYAPIAALPPPFQDPTARGKEGKSGNDECGSHSGGGGGGGASHSPTSSAATDTTTTSPHY